MTKRNTYLREMGVGAIWKLRERPDMAQADHVQDEAVQDDRALIERPASVEEDYLMAEPPCLEDIPPMEDIPPQYFGEETFDEPAGPGTQTGRPDVSHMDWDELEATIRQCELCGLCRGRTNAVPGVGDRNADWLFVGEGPGYYEDQQGEPFVGASGKLLDNMLLSIGLKRGERAYIANIVKCRASDGAGKDRPPAVEETTACFPYLERQIALIQPRIIVAIGRIAATTLLGTDPRTPLAVLRGKQHLYRTADGRTIPLVATYHPAYLLRQLSEKRKAWSDLCLAMQAFSE